MTKLIIPIEPKPQSRPRFNSRTGRAYEDKGMQAWRMNCTYYIKALYKGKKYTEKIKVSLRFYMEAPLYIAKKPTERSKKTTKDNYDNYINERVYCGKTPDIDNLTKSVLDSITKSNKIWSDDNIICELNAKKVYSPRPRIEVEITEL